jgi:hypothetical protein
VNKIIYFFFLAVVLYKSTYTMEYNESELTEKLSLLKNSIRSSELEEYCEKEQCIKKILKKDELNVLQGFGTIDADLKNCAISKNTIHGQDENIFVWEIKKSNAIQFKSQIVFEHDVTHMVYNDDAICITRSGSWLQSYEANNNKYTSKYIIDTMPVSFNDRKNVQYSLSANKNKKQIIIAALVKTLFTKEYLLKLVDFNLISLAEVNLSNIGDFDVYLADSGLIIMNQEKLILYDDTLKFKRYIGTHKNSINKVASFGCRLLSADNKQITLWDISKDEMHIKTFNHDDSFLGKWIQFLEFIDENTFISCDGQIIKLWKMDMNGPIAVRELIKGEKLIGVYDKQYVLFQKHGIVKGWYWQDYVLYKHYLNMLSLNQIKSMTVNELRKIIQKNEKKE